jgi:hypothetical protein
VVTLATRLGISSRHLARLFERHVGATPQQLAKTLWVQRAAVRRRACARCAGCDRSEEAGAEIEPISQAQHEHEQRGGCEHREMPNDEFARRNGNDNGFLRNRHNGLHYENDSWPPICGADIKRRDLQNNY